MKRSTLYALPLAVGVVVALTLALIQPRAHGSNLAVPEGGTFRISLAAGSGIDYIDPALAYTPAAWALLDTVCARLLAYPDKRPPASFRARARSGGRAAEGLARPAHVHVHVAHRLSLQRRHSRSRECVRACDQPDARTRRGVAGRPVDARHRRGRRRPGGADADRGGSRGQGEHARRPVHEAGVRLRGSDDVAVLLCGAADAAVGSRGLRRLPGRRAVLRRRVPARRTRRDQAQPLLRGIAAAPRRRLRRRPPRLVAAGDAHPCQAGRRRLGPHRRRDLLRSVACSRLHLRRQSLSVLRQARPDLEDARVQFVAAALPRQSATA